MKVLDIAFKDMLRSFRSSFLLVMMFVAPLTITGLIYFAFGSMSQGSHFDLPVTRVQIANLDRADSQSGLAAGQMLADYLQDKSLADLLQVTIVPDEAGARAAVDRREADAAIIIPPDFTAAVVEPNRQSTVTLYHDPALTVGPGIVKVVAGEFVDGLVGGKIAIGVAHAQMAARGAVLDDAAARNIVQGYVNWLQSVGHASGGTAANTVLATRSPSGETSTSNQPAGMIGLVMAGMLIFFVFFTAAGAASSIVYEDEEGTLARLFTTPTPQATILGGKFVAVLMTVLLQSIVLMIASSLIFGISWGELSSIALATLGLIVAASGFGVMLMSFIKTTRQTGPIQGGVLSFTGMLGGLFTSFIPNLPAALDTVYLITPQGWAMRSWKLALTGAGGGELLLPVAVMFVLGAAFFVVAALIFRRRFA